MRVASLFSGIGGLDRGLESAGLSVISMCESWSPARAVIADRFPLVPLSPDVRDFSATSPYEVLAAGFPCTNISHVGDRSGIEGPASGLVSHVFRVARESDPRWVILENVPNLLTLHKGAAMRSITGRLEDLGYRWAYRTVDSRFVGLPQRRPRVLILASRTEDPVGVLLSQDAGEPAAEPHAGDAAGFYWTEGRHGTGLVWGAVPTLKGGSTIGLGSTPAVWLRDRPVGKQIVTLTVEHGEQLQGLPPGWTRAAAESPGPAMRWKLVGNAVTTGVGQWLGKRLLGADGDGGRFGTTLTGSDRWPRAAAGGPGELPRLVGVSSWPEHQVPIPLTSVIAARAAPLLSTRAAAGFLRRLEGSGLPFDQSLRTALRAQVAADHPPVPRPQQVRPRESA